MKFQKGKERFRKDKCIAQKYKKMVQHLQEFRLFEHPREKCLGKRELDSGKNNLESLGHLAQRASGS